MFFFDGSKSSVISVKSLSFAFFAMMRLFSADKNTTNRKIRIFYIDIGGALFSRSFFHRKAMAL